MRIRRNVSRVFLRAVVPTFAAVWTLYFGYHALWGDRGLMVLRATEANLAQKQARLASLTAERNRLQHRITLLENKNSDIVEEIARTRLMEGTPDQVAVPRSALDK